jgi:hypothetical protein
MRLPFSRDEFLAEFARYNEAVCPAPLGWTGLAALTVYAVARQWRHDDRLASMLSHPFVHRVG